MNLRTASTQECRSGPCGPFSTWSDASREERGASPRPTFAMLALVVATAISCVAPAAHVKDAPATKGDGTEMIDVRGTWLRVLDTAQPEAPSGPPVVFVHGFGSRLESWKIVQPALAASRRTLSFDQRGFGLSERTDTNAYGPEEHAADLEALLNQRGIDRAVLVGHSYGAGVVLRFALRHPDRVAAIVLVSPFALDAQVATAFRWARVPGLGEYLFAASWRGFAGEKYLLAFHDPLRADEGKPRFVSAAALDEVEALQTREGSTYAQLATVRGMDYELIEEQYRAIGAPVSIVWGENDRITPFSTAPKFLDKLPHAQLVRIEKCGHMPSWEAPDAVIDAIVNVEAAR
jgi:pimeloyl-ACP methyl ester carboxylesterase